MARPTLYTPELVEEICQRLSDGEPLEQICRDEGMPCTRTIRDWQENKVETVPESVSSDIARARDIGFDVIAERTRDVARGKQGSTSDVQRDKLIIETDLKLLSKWSKKYGERQNVEVSHSGTIAHLTVDLPGLCGLIADVTASGTGPTIQGDVSSGSLLPAPVRAES